MDYILAVPALVWIIASSIFAAYGEYLSKKFALDPSWKIALFTVFIFALDSIFWLPAIFEKKQMVTTCLLWTTMSLVAIAALGFFVFHEKVTTVGAVGIAFAAVAIILLSI